MQNTEFIFDRLQWLTMPDGTQLSVNYWRPKASSMFEKFPIVLEVLPYRKEDMHAAADYAMGAYFAKQGIAFARVDIRGTGSSNGATPDREYSDHELQDILAIIKQLAALPFCNGNIGMQGISWSAFNSIMTAMQRPPNLKGILIAHGSEDLYANDIHNIDGALHLDIFTIEIEVDNILPLSPHYEINKDYFTDRFEQKPWIFSYLKHQRDGDYWQKHRSLKTDYAAIKIPVYAFASLLDGYRDYAINMLEHIKSPIKVAMGPQNHSWPSDYPGPIYEWRRQAVNFWRAVFNNKKEYWNENKFTVFLRDYVAPNLNLETTPGAYWSYDWPITPAKKLKLYPQSNGVLSHEIGEKDKHTLVYKATAGKGVLNWWGETTPDMRGADENTLIYDSEAMTENLYLLGNVYVQLRIASDAPYAHFIVRLEDVNPNGEVAFITGGLQNSAQRESRTKPKAIQPNKFYNLNFAMHFTSWTFKKGHRIRLIVTNAQFPMVWPTPHKMITSLIVGNESTAITLPLVTKKNQPKPILPPLEKYDNDPNITYLNYEPLQPFIVKQDEQGNITASAEEFFKFIAYGNTVSARYKVTYRVNDDKPEAAEFLGEGEDIVLVGNSKRSVKALASIHIKSDKHYFHTTVTRKIFENQKLIKTKTWKESIPRDFE